MSAHLCIGCYRLDNSLQDAGEKWNFHEWIRIEQFSSGKTPVCIFTIDTGERGVRWADFHSSRHWRDEIHEIIWILDWVGLGKVSLKITWMFLEKLGFPVETRTSSLGTGVLSSTLAHNLEPEPMVVSWGVRLPPVAVRIHLKLRLNGDSPFLAQFGKRRQKISCSARDEKIVFHDAAKNPQQYLHILHTSHSWHYPFKKAKNLPSGVAKRRRSKRHPHRAACHCIEFHWVQLLTSACVIAACGMSSLNAGLDWHLWIEVPLIVCWKREQMCSMYWRVKGVPFTSTFGSLSWLPFLNYKYSHKKISSIICRNLDKPPRLRFSICQSQPK